MVIANHRQARHGDARAEPDSRPSSAGTRGYLASMRTNVSARGQPISARGQPVSAREQSLFRHGSITRLAPPPDDDSRPHCRDSNGVYQGQVPGNRRDVHPTANARDSTRHANVAERASAEHADTVEFSEVRFGENRHTFPSGGVTSTDRATREPRRSSHSPTMVYTTRHVPEPTVPRHVNSHRQRRHPVDPVEHTPSDPPVATQQRRRARRTRRNRRYNRNQAAHVQTERRNLDMKRFNESVGLIVQKLGYEIALRPSNEDSTLTEGEISELVNRLNVIIEDRAIEVQFFEEMGNSVRENNFQDRSHSQDVRRSHHYVNAVTTRNTQHNTPGRDH
jgi:hypothetical protein